MNYKFINCMQYIISAILSLALISSYAQESPPNQTTIMQADDSVLEVATFGAGCFWCVEAVFEGLDGVTDVESGYMGGAIENPSYAEICTGTTGHAEVTRIQFNPEIISYAVLLEWLWRSHDPTTLNRQGYDVGSQYRSAIFYHNKAQQMAAQQSKEIAQEQFSDAIVTEIIAVSKYYPAEDYHQDYFRLNPNNPYCARIIAPKLKKLDLQ